jgi:signal transduction histidine kinase
MIRRTRLVYASLLIAWAIILVWQIVEHRRVRQATRVTLINRAKDISTTLGLVLRSQRRFGGLISEERIESAMAALVKPGELNGIALLNDAGQIVASAGAHVDLDLKGLVPTGEYWADRTVTLLNLVDLGTNVTAEAEENRPTIVMPRDERFGAFGTNRAAFPPPPAREPGPDGPPPPSARASNDNPAASTNAPPRPRDWARGRGRDGRPPFGRPFWMTEEEYKSLIQKQGVHSFAIVLSTQPLQAALTQDFWLRSVITSLAVLAVLGLGLAWSNLAKSSELEVRLVRAAELNARLKEMNLAAAGLAHETKNPLNIIRGLAQMISKRQDTSDEVRLKSRDIVDETDRVTAQLNEFINYSRPREVRRSTVALSSVVAEVVRALGYDLEEKALRLQVPDDLPAIEADEQLLRQALFNLLLNAIQAVPPQGEIRIEVRKNGSQQLALDICDNGPGVPPEHRVDIFKPYFTTTQNGTGLGLAVVQQIVLAHGWEIECLANEPQGAVFRITHL